MKVRSTHDVRLVHLAAQTNRLYESLVVTETFTSHGEWVLNKRLRLMEGESRKEESLSFPPTIYSEIHLQMRVTRKPWNYLFDVVLPLFFLSLFSLTSLGCSREALGDRLAITVTMILTSVTFKNVSNSTLPVLSYQTIVS